MNDLNPKFEKLVIKLQDLRKGYLGDYPDNVVKKIDEIGAKIKQEKLIDKCENKDWAKQLMIANDVPKKYWK